MSDSMSWCAHQEREEAERRRKEFCKKPEYIEMIKRKEEYEKFLETRLPSWVTVRDIEFLQAKPNYRSYGYDFEHIADIAFYTEQRLSRVRSIFDPIKEP